VGGPYRTAGGQRRSIEAERQPHPDRELVPVFALVWLASVVHVGFAIWSGATIGAFDVIAAGLIVTLPLSVAAPLREIVSRRSPGSR
jgi:hypothetical protein